jgi:hypothetical protein
MIDDKRHRYKGTIVLCRMLQFMKPKNSVDPYMIPSMLNTSCSTLLLHMKFVLDLDWGIKMNLIFIN